VSEKIIDPSSEHVRRPRELAVDPDLFLARYLHGLIQQIEELHM
jgi:hypothetical protein